MPGSWCGDIVDLIAALGGVPDNMDHRIVQDDKVIFTPTQDGYKKAIQTLHEWYQEGLIDPESFSQDDKAYLAKGKAATENLGSFVWWEVPEMVGADRADNYSLVPVLEGVDGKRIASQSNNQEIARGAFAITRANKYPAATMRWADNLYDPIQSAQANWGPIGETLQKDASGLLTQIPAPAGTSRRRTPPEGRPGRPEGQHGRELHDRRRTRTARRGTPEDRRTNSTSPSPATTATLRSPCPTRNSSRSAPSRPTPHPW